MPYTYRFTLFTPTYDRADILPQLYQSVRAQRFRDFEWLIVDDGSTDDTAALVRTWQAQGNDFPIRYLPVAHGGKCRAVNHALAQARGELFFTVDSDDRLTDDALEKADRRVRELPQDGHFCGISSRAATVRSAPTQAYTDGDLLLRYPRRGRPWMDGERVFVFYTAVHRHYLYPQFDGEDFLTEAVAWNRMAHDGYRMRFFDDTLCLYAYRPDGLTHAGSALFLQNPRGYGLWLREKARFLHASPLARLRMWYTFSCDLIGRCTAREAARYIGAPTAYLCAARAVHRVKARLRGTRIRS